MDYYTHVIHTTRDPALRVAAELALLRARLAHACGQGMGQDRRTRTSPAQPPRKQPRR